MKRVRMVLLLVMAIPLLGQSSRGAEIKDLISGQMFPLAMQLSDLNDQWRRLSVGGQTEPANPLTMFISMFQPAAAAYYTKGETVTVAGETFIVAYRAQPKGPSMAELMESGPTPPTPEKLTAQTQLALSLLNLRAVASLNDIRVFNLEQELAESERLAKEAAEAKEQKEWTASSESNVKQIALAALMYAQDYDETLPPMANADEVKEALLPYVKNGQIFLQPDADEAYVPNAFLSGKKISDIDNPEEMILFYEASPGEDGSRGAAFLDGHTAHLDASEWQRLKEISHIP